MTPDPGHTRHWTLSYVDSRADGQGVFGDAEPVQDGLRSKKITSGCMLRR
ncbi:hypothetical protein SSAG_00260 [Streptomyces sp. Mg1]|nr:hypothetical protein SSAG_00260 [Streptomyces sp. Mg1]